MTVNCVNNGGAGRTDCTFAASVTGGVISFAGRANAVVEYRLWDGKILVPGDSRLRSGSNAGFLRLDAFQLRPETFTEKNIISPNRFSNMRLRFRMDRSVIHDLILQLIAFLKAIFLAEAPTMFSPSIFCCWICGSACRLEDCKTDELGLAVHEDCYALRMALKRATDGARSKDPIRHLRREYLHGHAVRNLPN